MADKCSSGFCRYLVDQGLLSEEDVERLEAGSRERGMRLGQLLLKDRALSLKQVLTVLERQEDEPGRLFGELAVDEGLLSREQLEQALVRQRISRPHPAEVILEMGALEPRALLEALISYAKILEAHLAA